MEVKSIVNLWASAIRHYFLFIYSSQFGHVDDGGTNCGSERFARINTNEREVKICFIRTNLFCFRCEHSTRSVVLLLIPCMSMNISSLNCFSFCQCRFMQSGAASVIRWFSRLVATTCCREYPKMMTLFS